MPGNESALTFRRLVPRFVWPQAMDRLRKSKAAFIAEAVRGHHAVLVRTTRRGAAALGSLASTAPAGIGATSKPLPVAPPEPSREWIATDPLEVAFRRARAEAKARAEQEAA